MKGKLILLMIVTLLALPGFGQKKASHDKDKAEWRKEMLDLKLDFLANEINLRDDQKKQFVELYSQMETERRAIFKKIKTAEKSIKDNKDASESDYDKASKEISAAKAEMAQVEKQYDEKFATFLTKKQMYKLKEAEGKFTQKMQDCRDKKKHEKKK